MKFNSGGIELADFLEKDISEEYLSWLNDPIHMRYSAQRYSHHTTASAVIYLESFRNTPNRFFAIRVEGRLVGTATLYLDQNYQTASPGILIAPEQVGKGLGTRAWKMLAGEVPEHLGVRKISAGTIETNVAMLNLFRSSGMEFEARLVGAAIYQGAPTDILIYRKFFTPPFDCAKKG